MKFKIHKNPQRHLMQDKILAKVIAKVKLKPRKGHKRYFESLCVAIINQQLSTKAADTIEKRFRDIFNGKFPSPRQVLAKPPKALRKVGLSGNKVKYMKGLAKMMEKGRIDFKNFGKSADEKIIAQLVEVKGIGRWTAEMFLMFTLGRPDVFSHGDLGLRNAIKKLYKLDIKRHSKKYYALVESWSPHRTIAARYLWASLNS